MVGGIRIPKTGKRILPKYEYVTTISETTHFETFDKNMKMNNDAIA